MDTPSITSSTVSPVEVDSGAPGGDTPPAAKTSSVDQGASKTTTRQKRRLEKRRDKEAGQVEKLRKRAPAVRVTWSRHRLTSEGTCLEVVFDFSAVTASLLQEGTNDVKSL
jgi:hypothetical protein